jgi:RNase P subunit RPR2
MPRDGAIIFGDVLEVACDKCGRKGRYPIARLIEQRGSDAKGAGFAH